MFHKEVPMKTPPADMHHCARRQAIQAAFALVAQTLAPTFVHAQAEKASPIRLGQSAPIEGPLAKSGLLFRNAAQAVFAEANAQGGISGRAIELITLDDGGRSERTATNIKLLASQHQVIALFGFMGAGAHRIGALGAQQEGLAYVAPVSGAAELRQGNMPWVYHFRASHKDELQFIAKHTQQIGIRKTALLYEYNSQGWELRDAFTALVQSLGQGEPGLISIDQAGSDFSVKDAVALALADKPQCIILGADYAASAKFVDVARRAGFNGLFYALSTVGGQALIDQIGEKATGISVTQVVPFPWSEKSGVGRAFNQFCIKHKLSPSFEGMEAWLAANLLLDALRKLKTFSSARLMAELDKLPSRDFGSFTAVLSSKTGVATAFVDLTVYSRDGRFRL
jgi:branched-chain amino acid transport system substrate-binding protein